MLSNSVRIAVVITTYNSPDWLEKVFWGYSQQSDKNFELIIADDGSTDATKTLIEQYREKLPFPIHHVWHEDDGFRKTIILNKAIHHATSEYLIFTDGDCIPAPNFVAVHRNRAQAGHFLSGGYYKLALAPSQAITETDIVSGNAFDFNWLHKLGQPKSFKRTKLVESRFIRHALELLTPTRASWNGMNSSGFKADMLAVNGFDERMQYGGEDREFGERLMNNGIKSKQIRYSAICLHLDHARGYVNAEMWETNRKIRAEVKKDRRVWTPFGIEKTAEPNSTPNSASNTSG